ncbi:hypothetical protein TELCIR_02662 [Teladorsagia circumcincta]|uniref:Uncharacterized protein n=1 Tax=Teladorsagia circumcincta TaxID=45464 RepID=A0A2G9UYL6_TELCI|nr:hypothetical protein TELCIR_02662 [Teladorsagia circumcincta]
MLNKIYHKPLAEFIFLKVAGAAAAVGAAVGVVAAPPQLFWIRDKAKARIKCVKPSCPIRIHENDINAVLDEQESMYIEKEGCSYVTCANLRCRTRFCWQCGQTCRVGYDDIERGLFWVKLAVDVRAFALILYVPVFFLACMVGIPLYVLFAFPTFLAQRVYNNATVKTDYLTTAEKILVAFKMVSIFLAGIPVGLFLALNSIVTGGVIFTAYVAFTVFKATPYAEAFRRMLNRNEPAQECGTTKNIQ